MSMNKINLIFVCSIFVFGCKNKNLADRSNLHGDSIPVLHMKDTLKKDIPIEIEKENLQSEILPDTTINNKIKLDKSGSIYLPENTSLSVQAGTAGFLEVVGSFETIS